MSKYYLVRVSAGNHGAYDWIVSDDDKCSALQTGTIETLSRVVSQAKVILIVDPFRVRNFLADIPGRSKQQVKMAAPNLLEDDIGENIEDVSVLVGDHVNSKYQVAVFSQSWMNDICETFRQAGIGIEAVYSESSLIRQDTPEACLTVTSKCAFFYDGKSMVLPLELGALNSLLPRLLGTEARNSFQIVLESGLEQDVIDLEKLRGLVPSIQFNVRTLQRRLFEESAKSVLDKHSDRRLFNLLPDYVQNEEQNRRASRWAKVAGLLLAVALLTHIGFSTHRINQLKDAISVVKAEQEKTFRQAFPSVKRIVDAEVQSLRLLQSLEQEGPPPAEFLEILHRSTAALDGKDLEIDLAGLTFTDGVLLIKANTSNMAQLENYRAALSAALFAEVVSAQTSGTQVQGAIRVRALQE